MESGLSEEEAFEIVRQWEKLSANNWLTSNLKINRILTSIIAFLYI